MELAQALTDYELERGKPMPSANHALIQTSMIGAFLRCAEGYSIFTELSLELDGQPYVPDVSVYPRLKADPLHDQIKLTEPPLLVIEILSPTQPLDELIQKANAYLGAGVKSCWIVQPALEVIAVMEADKKPKLYTGGEVTDPGTGMTVNVEEIFGPFH